MAFVGAALAGCAVLVLVVIGLAWLLWSHFSLCREGVVREAQLPAHPLPPAHALPHVVVQVPVFNERPSSIAPLSAPPNDRAQVRPRRRLRASRTTTDAPPARPLLMAAKSASKFSVFMITAASAAFPARRQIEVNRPTNWTGLSRL